MVTHTLVASSEKWALPSASIMIFVKSQHEVLLGEPVKTTGEHAHLNAIKRIFVVRTAAAVTGVFSHFINPAHHFLARLGIVRNLFPKHEGISKLRHYGVLNIFRECAT